MTYDNYALRLEQAVCSPHRATRDAMLLHERRLARQRTGFRGVIPLDSCEHRAGDPLVCGSWLGILDLATGNPAALSGNDGHEAVLLEERQRRTYGATRYAEFGTERCLGWHHPA
jgi:hypothetical protein